MGKSLSIALFVFRSSKNIALPLDVVSLHNLGVVNFTISFSVCSFVVSNNVRAGPGSILSLFDFFLDQGRFLDDFRSLLGSEDIRVLVGLTSGRWLDWVALELSLSDSLAAEVVLLVIVR
jgi:hypothetical protein